MLTEFATWWLQRKNKKLIRSLVSDLFPLLHTAFHRQREDFFSHPPYWFPFNKLINSAGVDWLDLYDAALSFGNEVLLTIPEEQVMLLPQIEASYIDCVRQWEKDNLISQDRLNFCYLAWRFMHWRYPKVFLNSDGIEVYSVTRVTCHREIQEEPMGEFLTFEAAKNALKALSDGERIFWQRPAKDTQLMYSTKQELGENWKEKSDAELLLAWSEVAEPIALNKEGRLAVAYLESQAKDYYKASNELLPYQYFHIECTHRSPTIDSLSNDRLRDCRKLIVSEIHFEDAEREILNEYLHESGDLDFESILILVAKIDALENFP